MNVVVDKQEIKCPHCLTNSPIFEWKAEHKSGELAKVACPSCGWQPEGKGLTHFRGTLALQGLLKDLGKRHSKKKGGKP